MEAATGAGGGSAAAVSAGDDPLAPPMEACTCAGSFVVRDGLPPVTIWRDVADRLDTGCVGGGVWSASPVLIRYLAALDKDWRGQRVMELGAGSGTVGLALARLGAHVTLTDLPAMVHVLRVNVERNFPAGAAPDPSAAAVTCRAQRWGEPLGGGPYDVVVGADIVYMDGSFDPLVRTMVDAAQQGAVVIFAYAPQRGEAPSFWDEEPSSRFMRAAEEHFDVDVLGADIMPPPEDKEIAPFGCDTPIWIYEFKLRSGAASKAAA